jgi:branched-chain amino acid transport system substrate-binding protein
MKRQAFSIVASAVLTMCGAVTTQAKDIVITHVATLTGPFGPYGTQTSTGFAMGLEHLTGGTMTIGNRKIVVIQKDDQGKPDVAKALITAAYADDKSDIVVGPTLSASSLASLTVAEEAKKILLIDSAITDSITGESWNRYIFRTARTSSQDSSSAVLALPKDQDISIGFLSADAAYGHDALTAMKENLTANRPRVKVVHEEFLPQVTTDFTAATQRLIDALKDKPGRKVIAIAWAGPHPMAKVMAMQPERYGIEVNPGGNLLPVMQAWKNYAGTEGSIYYYYGFPKNETNDWLVAEYQKRFNQPPDFFVAGGMIAAAAVVEALTKTNGDTDTEKLIKAMEGMSFDSVKGTITIRKEDHQAMQEMYVFRIKKGAKDYDLLDLVRTITPDEVSIPIRNKAK